LVDFVAARLASEEPSELSLDFSAAWWLVAYASSGSGYWFMIKGLADRENLIESYFFLVGVRQV
jgi:hypothetical protein